MQFSDLYETRARKIVMALMAIALFLGLNMPTPGQSHRSKVERKSADALTVLAFHVVQQVGAQRIDLQRHDLSVTGREFIQTIVELEPGTTAPRHSHPGEEIIYVLEGTWEYTLDGKRPVTVKAGDVLFIPAGAIHAARNVGTDRGKELATYIVEKGKPLVVLAK